MMDSVRCVIRSKQFKHFQANHVASIPPSVFKTFLKHFKAYLQLHILAFIQNN